MEPRLSLLCAVDAKQLHHHGGHGHRTLRSVRLRRSEPEAPHLSSHVLGHLVLPDSVDVLSHAEYTGLEIHVTPSQREVLRRAEPTVQPDEDRQLVVLSDEPRNKPLGLLGSEEISLLRRHVWRLDATDRVD